MTMITLGAHLARVKTRRAAVIPYIVGSDGKIYLLLGVDKESGDFTDCGGGRRKTEYNLSACLREFKEETNEIFGKIYDVANDKALDIALLNSDQATLFIPVSEEWYENAPKSFKRVKFSGTFSKKRSHNEVSRLVWVSEDEFKDLLSTNNKKMWKKLKTFYSKGFSDELLAMLRTRGSDACH